MGGRVKRPVVEVALTVVGDTEVELLLVAFVVVLGWGLLFTSITAGPLGTTTVVFTLLLLVLFVVLLVVPFTAISAGLSTGGPAFALMALTRK